MPLDRWIIGWNDEKQLQYIIIQDIKKKYTWKYFQDNRCGPWYSRDVKNKFLFIIEWKSNAPRKQYILGIRVRYTTLSHPEPRNINLKINIIIRAGVIKSVGE